MPFDFYLPNFNLCIEYDGEQHTLGWNYGKNCENSLNIIKENDSIKNRYCINNNINILRISYLDYEFTEDILNKALKI